MFRLSMVLVCLMFCLNARATEFCVEIEGKDTAYLERQNPAITKEQKKYFNDLLSNEKKLLAELADQVLAKLDQFPELKKLGSVLQNGCLIINHDAKYSNTLMAYSAETDPYYVFAQQNTRLYHPKNSPDGKVRMNFTEGFIKLLAEAKLQRGESEVIQPAILGYAGSFLIRNASIASQTVTDSFLDLRKRSTAIKSMKENGLDKLISNMENKVTYELAAIAFQQSFIDGFQDEISEWFAAVSGEHPEFFREKTLWLEITDGGPKFVTKTGVVGEKNWTVFFHGQYRVPFIAQKIVNFAGLFSGLRGKKTSEEIEAAGYKSADLESYKQEIQNYIREWSIYINESSDSKEILQSFVMDGRLAPFISAYIDAFVQKNTNVNYSSDLPEFFIK